MLPQSYKRGMFAFREAHILHVNVTCGIDMRRVIWKTDATLASKDADYFLAPRRYWG